MEVSARGVGEGRWRRAAAATPTLVRRGIYLQRVGSSAADIYVQRLYSGSHPGRCGTLGVWPHEVQGPKQ